MPFAHDDPDGTSRCSHWDKCTMGGECAHWYPHFPYTDYDEDGEPEWSCQFPDYCDHVGARVYCAIKFNLLTQEPNWEL